MTKQTTTRRLGALLGAVATTLAMGTALLAPPIATAASQPGGQLVQTEPAKGTPHVLDGRVYSSVKVGNYLVLGGSFSRARNDSSTTEMTRNRLLAVDLRTNQIVPGFNPSPDDTVRALLPGADGQSVYVGGDFDSIAGTNRGRLVKLRIPDGSLDSSFDAGAITGGVRDLRLSGGRLWLAGAFTHVQGNAQTALATLDPATGRFDATWVSPSLGSTTAATTSVAKIDITPDGSPWSPSATSTTCGRASRRKPRPGLPAPPGRQPPRPAQLDTTYFVDPLLVVVLRTTCTTSTSRRTWHAPS